MKTPKILLPALRQYHHNDCSGLIAGFDHKETVRVVAHLQRQINAMKNCENCTQNGCDDFSNDSKVDFCLNHDHKHWQLGI